MAKKSHKVTLPESCKISTIHSDLPLQKTVIFYPGNRQYFFYSESIFFISNTTPCLEVGNEIAIILRNPLAICTDRVENELFWANKHRSHI